MSTSDVHDLTRGWNAAANLEPFDTFESAPWREGHRLWHRRKEASDALRRRHVFSHTSH